MATKTLGLGLLIVLAAGGGYYLLRERPNEAPVTPNEEIGNNGKSEEEEDEPKVVLKTVDVDFRADANTVPVEDRFLLPDGSWVRSLNGVKGAPPLDWPTDIPWSPIKRMVVDPTGQEWYEHEDGSMSTTMMTWRKDLGREDAMTVLANPTDPVPREMNVGPTLPDTGKKRQ